jgi:transcriptional regulator with XRE-family HTH domain
MSLLDEITDQSEEVDDLDLRLEERRMALIQQINEALERKGWTQSRLAEEMGKEDSQVTRLLSPESNPTLKTLVEFEVALDRDLFTVNRNIKFKVEERHLQEGQIIVSQAGEGVSGRPDTASSIEQRVRQGDIAGNYDQVKDNLALDSGKTSGTTSSTQ